MSWATGLTDMAAGKAMEKINRISALPKMLSYEAPSSGVSPEMGGWDPATSQAIDQANIQQNVADTNPLTRFANARVQGMNSPTSIVDKFQGGDWAGALGQYGALRHNTSFNKIFGSRDQQQNRNNGFML